jgi:peptidyl-dipeptidase Dcp
MANPLIDEWRTPHGVPPFKLIHTSHFEEALIEAMTQQINDINKICQIQIEDSTFDNIIVPFDKQGALFKRVQPLYNYLGSCMCSSELLALQSKMAGPLAAHNNSIYMYPGLFQRIDHVYINRFNSTWNLSIEQQRLVERFRLDFVRAGAKFDHASQLKYSAITQRIAQLHNTFAQNVLHDESSYALVLKKEDLKGLLESTIKAAKRVAKDRHYQDDEYVITLGRSLVDPFLTFSERRDLREKIWFVQIFFYVLSSYIILCT